MNLDDILKIEPYSLGRDDKKKLLTKRLLELTQLHRQNCAAYADMLKGVSFAGENVKSYEDLPFLPVRLFKERDLLSVGREDVVKTMTSSGTTGQRVSKIYLDRDTAANQQKALVKIVSDFTGVGRMPMIIADCPSVLKDRDKFSARGAAILGFSIFGTKKLYALDDAMKLDVEGLRAFLDTHRGQRILVFGFTFIIWQHFLRQLQRLKSEGVSFDLSDGVMIHGGGWKKLQSEAVSPEEFRECIRAACALTRVHDYYGMVEQTGCISMQCECGHLHASIFSDVIARRAKDFSICDFGEPGILQVVSTIPESYPGHLLLTEDEGVILGEDDCPCGRKGKYFRVSGRIAQAEIRGCSDTYAADYAAADKRRANDADAADKRGPNDIGAANCAAGTGVLKRVSILVGSASGLEQLGKIPPKAPFAEDVLAFADALSRQLMADKAAKAFPDVVTLGFWLRKASLLSMRERFLTKEGMLSGSRMAGRGSVFHIAPSNVPLNYAYSLFAGLLCGNANVVRIPSKEFPQTAMVNEAIRKLLAEQFLALQPYIHLVRYGRDREINNYFSSRCDVRVIWGGDDTIAALRQSPLPPRATEIVFADRYSFALIDADSYLQSEHKARIASDFYNDTYLSDQNACTSPRAVVWMGSRSRIAEAKEVFWNALADFAEDKYAFWAIQGVDKLSLLYNAAADYGVCKAGGRGNLLYRVQVSKLSPGLMDYRGNGGYFYEYDCEGSIDDMDGIDSKDILDFCNDTRCQTLCYIGEKKTFERLLASGIRGIDRVVPVGHTMDFDLIWDGYHLVERLTRTVRIV